MKTAIESVRAAEPQTIEDQIRLCEVEAPPFKETKRAQLYAQMFRDAGLTNVRIDKEGNVLGERRGSQPRPHLVFSAHLDTVFPEGTDVTVKREGVDASRAGHRRRLPRPGRRPRRRARDRQGAICRSPGTITFVGTVGEEGLGDLRGVKYLFREGLKGQIDRFVSVDGTGLGITHIARRQPALSGHLQRARRAQLRRVRHGQSDSGTRPGDGEDRRLRGAARSEDDVQCRTDRRRHVGQRDSVRGLGGGRHALGRSGGAAVARREVSEGDR